MREKQPSTVRQLGGDPDEIALSRDYDRWLGIKNRSGLTASRSAISHLLEAGEDDTAKPAVANWRNDRPEMPIVGDSLFASDLRDIHYFCDGRHHFDIVRALD